MKKCICSGLGILWSIITCSVYAQSSESEVSTEKYKADPYISFILNRIPDDWTFTATDTTFTFQSQDSLWVLAENRINAPVEKSEFREKRIKENGTKTISLLVIKYEDKWTLQQMQDALARNNFIDEELKALPERLKIAHLYNEKLSTKQGPVYIGDTEQEKKAIAEYYKEVSRLEGSRLRVPDFHSEKYSLFIMHVSGVNDDMHSVFPERTSLELYTIISTFREVCGK